MPRTLPYLIALAIAQAGFAHAADSRYSIEIATSKESDGGLRMQPRVRGPAGKAIRYEVNVRRAVGQGSADVTQTGSARLDDRGEAELSSNTVSLAPGDRYDLKVRVFEGDRLVAEQSTSRP